MLKNIRSSHLIWSDNATGRITPQAGKLINELREDENFIYNKKLVCGKIDRKIYDFTVFKNPIKFASVIFNKGSLKDAKDSQNEMLVMLNYLKNYNPKNLKKIKSREGTLINAQIFYDDRKKVINAFEDGVFPFEDGF